MLMVGCVIRETVAPRLNRKAMTSKILDGLREEHKTYARAGNADGRYYTPFKATCNEVLREVTRRPGITMKELVESIRTHYSSSSTARSALSRWIQDGYVPGVVARKEGRLLKIYPKEIPGR